MIKRVLPLALALLLLLSGCSADTPHNDVVITDDNAEVTKPSTESSEPEPEIEETPIYDTSKILEAHESGDTSPLSEKDKAIYDAALSAISEFYTDGMSDAEIITAAHDWIVTNITYDAGMLLAIPDKTDETENPYGALILHQGICMGYTTTFQLFMDLLGVDSQIVRGTASGDGEWEEHAWNLVCIDGEYYHVDTTWDDFVPDEPERQAFHIYLLVPDSVMEQLHRWDRDAVPSATSDDLIYYKSRGLYAEKRSDSERIQGEAHTNRQDYCEIMSPSSKAVGFNHVDYYWVNDLGDYVVTIYWMN